MQSGGGCNAPKPARFSRSGGSIGTVPLVAPSGHKLVGSVAVLVEETLTYEAQGITVLNKGFVNPNVWHCSQISNLILIK